MTTYQITRGQQYDRDGAYVSWDSLWAAYKHDGTRDAGHMVSEEDLEAVESAVRRVIASSEPVTLVLGKVEPKSATNWDRHEALMQQMDNPNSNL